MRPLVNAAQIERSRSERHISLLLAPCGIRRQLPTATAGIVTAPCLRSSLDYSINSDTIVFMASIPDILAQMRENPKGIRFNDLCKVCELYFGQARQSGSSHRIYKTPWMGDPRVNIQDAKGKAKPYQVRQVEVRPAKLQGRTPLFVSY